MFDFTHQARPGRAVFSGAVMPVPVGTVDAPGSALEPRISNQPWRKL